MLQSHSDLVTGVAMSPDGRCAVSVGYDQALKVWDLDLGASVITFTRDATAMCCAFAGAHSIVAGDQAGRVHFLELMGKS
jgi:WD40 repeat protein